MILTIDIGNTSKKYYLFQGEKIIDRGSWVNENELPKASKVIASNVSGYQLKLKASSPKDLFKNGFFLDMPVHYEKTLGEDRLVCAYYVYKSFETPSICIDLGTFTTIDVISKNGFMGGHILPGVNLIKESYSKGHDLSFPHLKNLESKAPQKTADAINTGAQIAITAPIQNILDSYKDYNVILTGGHAFEIKEFFTFKFEHQENLLAMALNFISKEMG